MSLRETVLERLWLAWTAETNRIDFQALSCHVQSAPTGLRHRRRVMCRAHIHGAAGNFPGRYPGPLERNSRALATRVDVDTQPRNLVAVGSAFGARARRPSQARAAQTAALTL